MANLQRDLPVCGYPRLAREMEIAPSIAMVRQFTALNNESLLYFQAQLVRLEKDLRELQRRDNRPDAGVEPEVDPRCSASWEWLGVASPECAQWKKVLEIRKVLKEYSMWNWRLFRVVLRLICPR